MENIQINKTKKTDSVLKAGLILNIVFCAISSICYILLIIKLKIHYKGIEMPVVEKIKVVIFIYRIIISSLIFIMTILFMKNKVKCKKIIGVLSIFGFLLISAILILVGKTIDDENKTALP